MLATKNNLKDLLYTYPKSKKQVAFYDKKRFKPSKFAGVKDKQILNKKTFTDKFGIENKEGEQLVELYLYVRSPDDKYSIHDQRVKDILIEGHGLICETKKYPEAYEKYKKFKERGFVVEKDAEKEELLQKNISLQEEIVRLQEERKKELERIKKLEEAVNAPSEPAKEVKNGNTSNNISKHRKGSKK